MSLSERVTEPAPHCGNSELGTFSGPKTHLVEQARDRTRIGEGKRTVRDALLRVAVFSPRDVAKSIAAFYRFIRWDSQRTFTDTLSGQVSMYDAMRRETFNSEAQTISDSTMALLATGCVYKLK